MSIKFSNAELSYFAAQCFKILDNDQELAKENEETKPEDNADE